MKLEIIEELGKGSYGKVFSCKDEKGKRYAVKKTWKTSDYIGIGSITELNFLNEIKHPNIIKLYECVFEEPFINSNSRSIKKILNDIPQDSIEEGLYYIMEQGSIMLDEYSETKDKDFKLFPIIIVQLLLALEYLHERLIFHRDLSCGNITLVFTKSGQVSAKIIDFGLAGIYSSYDLHDQGVVTSQYRAPEVCCENLYTTKIDIWSLGCVIYRLFVGDFFIKKYKKDKEKNENYNMLTRIVENIPGKLDIEGLKKVIANGRHDFSKVDIKKRKNKDLTYMDILFSKDTEKYKKYFKNEDDSYPLEDLLHNMLQIDPDKRFTASQLLNHPFCIQYKDYIDKIREKYTPMNRIIYYNEISGIKEEDVFTILDLPERKWAMNSFIEVFNNQSCYDWYKHSILIHGMLIFDMYLTYRYQNTKTKIIKSDDKVGKTNMTRERAHFYARACLYLYYKFVSRLIVLEDFRSFFDEEYNFIKGEKTLLEDFELEILQECLDYRIFRTSILEWLELNYGDENKSDLYKAVEIKLLVREYTRIKTFEGNIYELFAKIMKNIK